MRNVTVSVEDEVYLAARRKAAEQNVSLSHLVAEYLRSLSKEDELRAERQRLLTAAFQQADARTDYLIAEPFHRAELYDSDFR
jgi:DNA helicase TIP49 (TBP-interacting protein)